VIVVDDGLILGFWVLGGVGLVVGSKVLGVDDGLVVGFSVLGRGVGSAVGLRDGFEVGSFEGLSVAGIRVGGAVGGLDIKVGDAVSLSHRMRSRTPCKSVAAISSSEPPVPKKPCSFFTKQPLSGKSPVKKSPPVFMLRNALKHCS
jgi:hypothetical protein